MTLIRAFAWMPIHRSRPSALCCEDWVRFCVHYTELFPYLFHFVTNFVFFFDLVLWQLVKNFESSVLSKINLSLFQWLIPDTFGVEYRIEVRFLSRCVVCYFSLFLSLDYCIWTVWSHITNCHNCKIVYALGLVICGFNFFSKEKGSILLVIRIKVVLLLSSVIK